MSDTSPPVTHIVVGTKAQFIKMAPIARILDDRDLPYRLLDLGQHGSITPRIFEDFGLKPDHVYVLPAGKTVATYRQAARWMTVAIARILSPRQKLKTALLQNPPGCALIHGDTLSTLLGLYLSKRLGMKVGLVEAGLTSYRLFDPFPEELIRRHAERRVDYLFAPGDVPAQHLMQKRLAGQVVNTGYNTGRDALAIIENLNARQRSAHPVRAVMTLHRAETLSRPARLKKIVDHVVRLAPAIGPVEFYIHEPTRRSLARMGLLNELEQNDYFRLSALGSYPKFTRALASAHYVLTDGGSIQEEAAYLGKPCLILRKTTERKEGLARTAMLTSFDKERDLSFLRNVALNSVPPDFDSAHMSASKLIVDTVT